MVTKRRPPAKVNQPRAVRTATASAVEGKTPYGRERWSRISAAIARTNAARSEIDASIRGVEIGPALAKLPVMQHLAEMSLHDTTAPKLIPREQISGLPATDPPPERAEIELPFLLFAKLANHCIRNGLTVEAAVERIFADLPPAPSEAA